MSKTQAMVRFQRLISALPFAEREAAMKSDSEIRSLLDILNADRPKPEQIIARYASSRSSQA